MSHFYVNLARLEKLLANKLNITDSGEGLLTVNGHLIDTNQQLEMLSPNFFIGTAELNQTNNAYFKLFQKLGILPSNTSEIPLIRDIPLRTYTKHPQAAEHHRIFSQFLEQFILPNQWTMFFPEEYNQLRHAIAASYTQKPKDRKKITLALDGKVLESGGYQVELHTVLGLPLWLISPESLSDNDVTIAIDKSLVDTNNTAIIVNHLKTKLLQKNRLAFNVRGVSRSVASIEEVHNTTQGGGHQYFLMLDRSKQTIYAINNTKDGTDEDVRVFKTQIQLFLQSLGDNTNFKFEFIQGKSRQPDNASYLRQVCSISQFCHYAAILSGVGLHELQDTVPAKATTLMYLLQYAFINQDKELSKILNDLIGEINKQLELPKTSTADPVSSSTDTKPELINYQTMELTEKIACVKQHFYSHVSMLKVIERLEQGINSFNPYWINSEKKLTAIVDCLIDSINQELDIDILLADPESDLSKAVNMRRLPHFSFFGCCDANDSLVKSREIINEFKM